MENRYERLLEAYFAGTLTQAEQKEIDTLLASDPDFIAEFGWQKSVARAVRTGAENDPLSIKLKELERRFRFRRVIMQISAIAATFVLLISAIWFFNQPEFFKEKSQVAIIKDTVSISKPSLSSSSTQDSTDEAKIREAREQERDRQQAEEALRRQQEEARKKRDSLKQAVVAHFQHFPNTTPYNNAGSVNKDDSLAVKAYHFYNDSAYHQAVQAFKVLVEADTSNVENRFYYGLSLLGDKQFADAAKNFQLVTQKQVKYQVPAKFFLGMAFSGAGQFKAGRKAFQDYLAAPKNNQQFKDLAKNMLKKLPPE